MEQWSGKDGACCRLIVGMQRAAEADVRAAFTLLPDTEMDNGTATRLRTKMAQEFRDQLTFGAPTNADEAGPAPPERAIEGEKARRQAVSALPAARQALSRLPRRPDNPRTGYMGSSNLTFAGLKQQGELNVDVLDHDARRSCERWFDDRWNDRFCLDISAELADIIDKSWARAKTRRRTTSTSRWPTTSPRRRGQDLQEFGIPREFDATPLRVPEGGGEDRRAPRQQARRRADR